MSYLYNLFFIVINHIMSLKEAHLVFAHFQNYILLFLNDNLDEEGE